MNWYNQIKLADRRQYLIEKLGIPIEVVNWADQISKQVEPSGKYIQWIAEQNIKKNILTKEDNNKIIENLKLFHELKQKNKIKGKEADIRSFINPNNLSEFLEKFKSGDIDSKREKEKKLTEEGVKTVFSLGNVDVVEISTQEAASKLCRFPNNEGWCIKDPKFYKKYTPPFYLFYVDGERYALFNDKSGEFKNIDDKTLTKKEIIPIAEAAKELIKNNNFVLKEDYMVLYEMYPEELRDNAYEGWKKYLTENTYAWEDVPEEFKTEELKNHVYQVWKKELMKNPNYWINVPEEFRTEELKNIVYKSWKKYLTENAYDWEKIPEEFITEELKNISYEGWLMDNPLNWEKISEELKTPKLWNITYETWKKSLIGYPHNWRSIPEEFKLEELRNIAYEAWKKELAKNPEAGMDMWRYLPEEFNTEELRTIVYERWKKELIKHPYIWEDIPEELKTEELKNIAYEAWKKELMEKPEAAMELWKRIPKELKTKELEQIFYKVYKKNELV